MTPSKPIKSPIGLSASVNWAINEAPSIFTFAKIQINAPAGAATRTALPKTNTVLSNKERISICPIFGRLYGGSSSVKDELMPFSIVEERIFAARKVIKTPKMITPVSKNGEKKLPAAKKIVIIVIRVGNLPLQGTKLFVKMAMSLSLGESIILQPETPAALQPKPIAVVEIRFGCAVKKACKQAVLTDCLLRENRETIDLTRRKHQMEQITQIKIHELSAFVNHPFRVKHDEEMDKLKESIEQHGVLTPLIVRPKENGILELISGHRRKLAAELIGLDKLPVIIRSMSDDEAAVLMVDSNIQRENLLPSEKAYAY